MTGELGAVEEEFGEESLDDPEELLYRQVHPSWVQDGVPSSQTFKPTKKDAGMLSVALGSKTSAEGAFNHHMQALERKSAGTWAVTVGEVTEAGLTSHAQPLDDNPDHGFIDFRGRGRGEIERSAKVLLAKARDRGCLYSEQP